MSSSNWGNGWNKCVLIFLKLADAGYILYCHRGRVGKPVSVMFVRGWMDSSAFFFFVEGREGPCDAICVLGGWEGFCVFLILTNRVKVLLTYLMEKLNTWSLRFFKVLKYVINSFKHWFFILAIAWISWPGLYFMLRIFNIIYQI